MTDGIGRCRVGDNRGSPAERRTGGERRTSPDRGTAAVPNAAKPYAGERRTGRPEGPVLPDRSRDDLDVGWGDDPAHGRDPGARDDDWYQRERPPHYE